MNPTATPNGSGDEKRRIAKAILNNATIGKSPNSKIEDGKKAYEDDIYSKLNQEYYYKDDTIKFNLYKKEKEFLYLHATAEGTRSHDKEFLKQEGAFFEIGGKCTCEEKVRAFMRMLRVKEGSEREEGYTRLFGNGDFTKPPHNKDMSTHPNINVYWYTDRRGQRVYSSATGAYQIMKDTYKGFQGYYKDGNGNWVYSEKIDYIKKYNIRSFDQESQDKLCLVIFKHNYVQKRSRSFFYNDDGTVHADRKE